MERALVDSKVAVQVIRLIDRALYPIACILPCANNWNELRINRVHNRSKRNW